MPKYKDTFDSEWSEFYYKYLWPLSEQYKNKLCSNVKANKMINNRVNYIFIILMIIESKKKAFECRL